MIKNNKCDNITVHQISDLSKISLIEQSFNFKMVEFQFMEN